MCECQLKLQSNLDIVSPDYAACLDCYISTADSGLTLMSDYTAIVITDGLALSTPKTSFT